MRLLVGLLLATIGFNIVMVANGSWREDDIGFNSTVTTWLALMVAGAYAVFFDSRRRWPGVSWLDRLGAIAFFERDPRKK